MAAEVVNITTIREEIQMITPTVIVEVTIMVTVTTIAATRSMIMRVATTRAMEIELITIIEAIIITASKEGIRETTITRVDIGAEAEEEGTETTNRDLTLPNKRRSDMLVMCTMFRSN